MVVVVVLNCAEDKIPVELEEFVRAGVEAGAVLSGTVQPEAIGFEKIICNVIALQPFALPCYFLFQGYNMY